MMREWRVGALLLAALLPSALCAGYSVEDSSTVVRLRRQAPATDAQPLATGGRFPGDDLNIGPEAEQELDKPLNETAEWAAAGGNFSVQESDALYYTVRYHSSDVANRQAFWLDVDALIAAHPGTSAAYHPQLASSYRRAVSLVLSFDFPFYGHRLRNLTIATGGFCYVGDQMHSWLAATQYVAPLMGNFDTTPSWASIRYADTGSAMVVEWRNVVLRNQPHAGNFSFQVSLHSNGSIWFAYAEVPIEVARISDSHHPRKVGLSDAYLYEHRLPLKTPVGKRVIYEYHRVEVPDGKVATDAVVEIVPRPTCIAIQSCGECVNATLESFNCSWCSSKESGKPFCSDENGLHRRRQDWSRGQCRLQSETAYCTEEAATTAAPSTTTAPALPDPRGPDPTAPPSRRQDPPARRRPDESSSPHLSPSEAGGGSGLVLVLVIVASVVALGGWVAYAYLNPHTPSGQLLIKYRPGRWRMPGSHGDVRYTASVHM